MAIIQPLRGDTPVIGERTFLAENAAIIGSVKMGEDFVFTLQNIGSIDMKLYSTNGKMVASHRGSTQINIPTTGISSGVYFYMAIDDKGYKYTGKLLVKE